MDSTESNETKREYEAMCVKCNEALTTQVSYLFSSSCISFLIHYKCIQSSAVCTQQGFLRYNNPDYNISIQYPANWTKNEDNLPPNSPVSFSYPTPYPPFDAVMVIYVNQDNRTLDQTVITTKYNDALLAEKGDLRVINSSYTTLSGGLRAWQEIAYDYANDKNVKNLFVMTVKDGEQYQITFSTQPSKFNKYLPIAEQMIKSFQITR